MSGGLKYTQNNTSTRIVYPQFEIDMIVSANGCTVDFV